MLPELDLAEIAQRRPDGFDEVCGECGAFVVKGKSCPSGCKGAIYRPYVDDPFQRFVMRDLFDSMEVVLDSRIPPGSGGFIITAPSGVEPHGLGHMVEVGTVADEAPARGYKRKRGRRPAAARHRSESAIQDGCKQEIRLAGGYVIITTGSPYLPTGTPDLICCVCGRTVVIEIKRPNLRPDPAQMGELRKWANAGAIAGWATDEEHVRQLLSHVNDPTWINPLTGPGDGS